MRELASLTTGAISTGMEVAHLGLFKERLIVVRLCAILCLGLHRARACCVQGIGVAFILTRQARFWGSPKPIHLKPGHLKMAFFSARWRLESRRHLFV